MKRIAGATTVKSAMAGSPGIVWSEFIVLEILCFNPAVLPVTITGIRQVVLAAQVAAENEIVPVVTTNVPPQIDDVPVGLAVKPIGKVSVNTTFVTPVDKGFLSVNVSVEGILFNGMLIGENTLISINFLIICRVSDEVFPMPPLSELTFTLLSLSASVLGVVSIAKVHIAPGANEPAVRETKPPPAFTFPPQATKVVGATTVRSAGKMSLKKIPVRVMPTFSGGLEILNCKCETPFKSTGFSKNNFSITGGEITVRDARPGPPFPPSLDVTGPVLLLSTPPIVEATTTVMLQDAPELSVPLVSLTKVSPGWPPSRLPPHPLFDAAVTTVIPVGKVSVKPMPVKVAVKLGLLIGIVKVETPSRGMIVGKNDLETLGGRTINRVALAASPSPLLVAVAVEVLILGFGVMSIPVTATLNLQDVPTSIIGIATEIVPVPGPATKVPVQERVVAGAAATFIPRGRTSMNVPPPNETLVKVPDEKYGGFGASTFGLVIVNSAMATPFCGMLGISRLVVVDRNFFASVGGNSTDIASDAVSPGPPSVDPTTLVVFIFSPRVVPFRTTVTVQFPLGGKEAPVNPIVVRVVFNVPLQVLDELTTSKPLGNCAGAAGRLSVKLIPVKSAPASTLGFSIVNFNVMLSLSLIPLPVGEENTLLISGGPTMRMNLSALAVPPLEVVTDAKF